MAGLGFAPNLSAVRMDDLPNVVKPQARTSLGSYVFVVGPVELLEDLFSLIRLHTRTLIPHVKNIAISSVFDPLRNLGAW